MEITMAEVEQQIEISPKDLLDAARDQKPMEFSDAFTELVKQRIAGRVNDMRVDMAQKVFSRETDD